MTYRERREARAEKRREWAASRAAKASAAFESARRTADAIPLGQPILVGHHSEKRHRRDIARIDSGMRRGVESEKMAAHHLSAAAGIEEQLDRSIYDDDPDAAEQLAARVKALEEKRARMVAENKAFRKGPAAYAAHLGITAEQEQARRIRIMGGLSWCRQPHPAYELSNLGGNITRYRKRLQNLETKTKLTAQAEAAPGGVLVTDCGGGYVVVRFAEKPERDTLETLRAAGCRWSGGAWCGYRDKLPAGFLETLTASEVTA